MPPLSENHIEQFTLETLQSLGYQYLHAPVLAADGDFPEREDYNQVVLTERLRQAIQRINPNIPADAREHALREVLRLQSPDVLANNETFHRYLTDGISVTFRVNGEARSDYVWLIDFANPTDNDLLVTNQFTIVSNHHTRRMDVLLLVNGLPLVLIELKNAGDENATIQKAFSQVETYKSLLPQLFTYNAFSVISDGLECRAGTLSADFSRYMAWKSADGVKEASRFSPQVETLLKGMLNPNTLLDLVRNFIVFEKSGKQDLKTGLVQVVTVKKLAAYHQYYAVNKAVERTINAMGLSSDSPSPNLSQRERNAPSSLWEEPEERKSEERKSDTHYRAGLDRVTLLESVRHLRQAQTPAEAIFWEVVRNRRLFNLKFRRQHQIGPYIVDFFCNECKLVIELDGAWHQDEDQQLEDKQRDSFLRSQGFTVLRFPNDDVLERIDAVVETIYEHWKSGSPSSNLSQRERNKLSSPCEEPEEGKKGKEGTRKAGVIWHTQGSGKSLSMMFYAAKLITTPELQNPTIVVITDRNDLDDQLFDTFAASKQLLRQEPVQAKNRQHLKELLRVGSGGIVFTTIQKFLPPEGQASYDLLSDRSNVVVIADEAHRTQYGFEAEVKKVVDKTTGVVVGSRIAYGFAKYLRDALPMATYIGFTGTPIESTDINTPAVFGNYIHIYDIAQAVEDKATVRIYYESRLAKVNLSEEGRKLIEEFDRELEEDDEITESERAKVKWTKLESIVGHPERLHNLARDIVNHFEERQSVFEGKGMIVCMSRRIAADLYEEIRNLRPEWHDNDLGKGAIKVVMTAVSSDGPKMSQHHTTKGQRRALADRMKDPDDPLKLVIVRDMWLTGFDAPSMHTLYIDKPMRGHNLMQAIARVNRVFKNKPGGLVVDYLGIGSDLKKALAFYSDSGGKGDPTEVQARAAESLLEKLEVVRQMFFEESRSYKDIVAEEPTAYYDNYPGVGFNYKRFFSAPPQEKLSIILQAEEHILGLDKGKERFSREVSMLGQALALAIPHEDALRHKEEVAFFQAVRARLVKFEGEAAEDRDEDYHSVIKRIVDSALSSDQVVDIFDAAGIRKPEISILSEEFLLEIKDMKHQNLALELLRKILNDEIKSRLKTNLVRSRKLLEMLEDAMRRYQNNLLSTAEIIQELIDLAREVRESDKRGEDLGLRADELAFYDALETNDSAVQVLGDETLRHIAREIAEKVKSNATIDWAVKESARAKLMVLVRRTLNKYKYPPDKQQKAVETVLRQAELMADWLVG